MPDTLPVVPDPQTITFALLLTAAGTGIAAGLVTGLVALLRSVFAQVAEVSGALVAFIVSAILYVLAAIATGAWSSLDTALVVFIAWLTCASAAVGLNQVVGRAALTR